MTSSLSQLSIEHGMAADCDEVALPATLADLLTVAISDARQLDPELYSPRSGHWHYMINDSPCYVCLAGCVIAVSLHHSPYFDKQPWMFPQHTADKLYALNYMRCGRWLDAYHLLYGHVPARFIETELFYLRMPKMNTFDNWDDFHVHLDSLESIVPDLRRIESLTVPA